MMEDYSQAVIKVRCPSVLFLPDPGLSSPSRVRCNLEIEHKDRHKFAISWGWDLKVKVVESKNDLQ